MPGLDPTHQHRLVPAHSKQPAARALPLREQLICWKSCRLHFTASKLCQKLQSLSKHNLNNLGGLVPISKHSDEKRF